ncbi:MAG: hypothetical protein WCH43_08795 [Verrucomicrobiota bacterium]
MIQLAWHFLTVPSFYSGPPHAFRISPWDEHGAVGIMSIKLPASCDTITSEQHHPVLFPLRTNEVKARGAVSGTGLGRTGTKQMNEESRKGPSAYGVVQILRG